MTQLTRPLQAFSLILALAGGAGAILSLDAVQPDPAAAQMNRT